MFDYLKTLTGKKALSTEQISSFVEGAENGKINTVQQAAVLAGLNIKGIDPKELAEFVKVLSEKNSEQLNLSDAIGLSDNSELSAFIVSGMNVPVVSHGDSALSGMPDIGVIKLEKIHSLLGFCFINDRKFYPAIKNFDLVRKNLGIHTIFNLIEPLLNPANVKKQIIETDSRENMLLIVESAKILKRKHVMVVFNAKKTYIAELQSGKIKTYSLSPKSFGSNIDASENIGAPVMGFNHRCQNSVLINCALALKLFGKFSNLKRAYQEAFKYAMSGKAYSHFLSYNNYRNTPEILLDEVVIKNKELEKRKNKLPLRKFIRKVRPSDRDFKAAILQRGISLIAEIKKGQLPTEAARAISGDLNNLRKIRESTKEIPLLCKDFIIDEYQIYEARYFGADAILLNIGLLSKEQIQSCLKIAGSLKMAVLCEVHTEEELKILLETSAEIIVINNRYPNTLKISLNTTARLARKIPANKIIVSVGGISNRSHVKELPKRTDAIIVGGKIDGLMGKPKPLLKLCGIRSVKDAIFCAKMGVDMIGLNFVPTSHRRISYQLAGQIIQEIRKQKSGMKVAGVFQNQNLNEVNTAAEKLDLDFIQLSGDELISYIKKCKRPVIKRIYLTRKSSLNKASRYSKFIKYVLLDSSQSDPKKIFDLKILKKLLVPFLISGNIELGNVRHIMKEICPAGIDVAGGIESDGEVDLRKISKLVKCFSPKN